LLPKTPKPLPSALIIKKVSNYNELMAFDLRFL